MSIYNIDSYTDQELFSILDLNSPTDRELEARILFLINKYENMQNTSGKELVGFFNKIYNHFFEIEEEEEEEEEEDEQEGFDTIAADGYMDISRNIVSDYTKIKPTPSLNIFNNQVNDLSDNIPVTSSYKSSDIGFTKTLEYAKDQLNPLLQQTIKRVISIDSQYRDNKQALSTDFTFNLSDPLKDVVSLKLYSVQIPYTWYTINTAFGSNFFYIKGNVPGIDTGTHDLKIDISAGNYGPSDLANVINKSIQKIAAINTDISFATTGISYNSFTSLMTTTIDITNRYSENSYYLKFSDWTSPIDTNLNETTGIRFQSIPGYLGYNNIFYNPNKINSNLLPLTTNSINDDNNRKFILTNKNNYFTVIQYIGPDELLSTNIGTNIDYSSVSNNIIDSSNIYLNTAIGIPVSRNTLITDLSNQLYTNNFITSDSGIKRIDITDTNLAGNNNSYFELSMKPNRFITKNSKDSKLAIIFPNETDSINSIWTGPGSCFNFEYKVNELNSIISEASPIQLGTSTYLIDSNPYIYLRCINPQFDLSGTDITWPVSTNLNKNIPYTQSGSLYDANSNLLYPDFSNNINISNSNRPINYNDLSINDFIITIPNSIVNYTITDYINTINTSLKNYSNFGINMTKSSAFIDNNTNKFTMNIEINKNFDQSYYSVDLTNGYLNKNMGFDLFYDDLSGTNNIIINKPVFQIANSYTIGNDQLITILPSKKNYGNKNQKPYSVMSPAGIYNTYQDLQNAINNAFTTFQDSNTGLNILSGTNISIKPSTSGKLTCSLTIIIQKILSEKDYSIQFIDPSLSVYSSATTRINNKSTLFTQSKSNYNYVYTDISSAYNNLSKIKNNSLNYRSITKKNTLLTDHIFYTDLGSAFTDLSNNYSPSKNITTILENNIYITQNYYSDLNTNENKIIKKIILATDIYLITDNISNYYKNKQSFYLINTSNISNTNATKIYIIGSDTTYNGQLLDTTNIIYEIDAPNIYKISSSNTTNINTKTDPLYVLDLSKHYYQDKSNYYIDPVYDICSNIPNNSFYYIDTKDLSNNYKIVDSNNTPYTSVYTYKSNTNIYSISSANRTINDISNIFIINNQSNYQTKNGDYYIDPTNITTKYNDISFVYFIADSSLSLRSPSNINTSPTNPHIICVDISNAYLINTPYRYIPDYTSSSWYKNLNIDLTMIQGSYNLSKTNYDNNQTGEHYSDISGAKTIDQYKITLTEKNNKITLVPYEDGVIGSGDIEIKLLVGTYTRDNLINLINSSIPQLASGTYITTFINNGKEYTKLRININKIYTAADYRISYYDPFSFVKCYVGVTSVRNTTWDTTLGWILGYRANTVYQLSDYGTKNMPISIPGDTGVSTNLFNYFMICLDDYNQNHLNDGLVTITSKDVDISLPSYASKAQFQCDPITGAKTYNTLIDSTSDYSKLTQNQIYSLTQIANSRTNGMVKSTASGSVTNSQSYGLGPFVKDVFAIIPMKLSGLQNGQSYVEFGGTLQNQDRIYFGPVNIHRMSVKLISDKGDVLDLNGANWSFCLICEQLYKQNPGKSKS